MSRYESQYLLWGTLGQEVLSRSSLLICGLNHLGYAISQSAALLGIGTIYLLDDVVPKKTETYLDLQSIQGEPRSLAVKRALDVLAPSVNTIALPVRPEKFPFPSLDIVISTATEVEERQPNLHLPTIYASASKEGGSIYPISSNVPFAVQQMGPSSLSSSGRIASLLLGGCVVDEIRKYLFVKNIDVFAHALVATPAGMRSYAEVVAKEHRLTNRLDYYDPVLLQEDDCFHKKNILVIGAGSIGSVLIDTLCRLQPALLTVLDADIYEEHNLNRQPLAYDGVLRWKADVLSEKVQKITQGLVPCKGAVGFLGSQQEYSSYQEQLHGRFASLDTSRLEYMDASWLSFLQPDLIFCCVDNNEARRFLADAAVRLHMRVIDAGTSATSSRVNVFVPGKTRCLHCSNTGLDAVLTTATFPVPATALNHRSCRYQEGSVIMTNQIVAGLALQEAGRVFADELLFERIGFDANSPSRFSYVRAQPVCTCA
jgi:molybdopterin/thiamine biosynthesis adenylyltransferase